MTRLSQDIETFSVLDLRKVGVSRYARHPSTEIIMLAYAFDDGPIRQWDALSAIGPRDRYRPGAYAKAWLASAPSDWIEAMDDPYVDKCGWNVGQFERPVYREVLQLDIPPDEWRDTMVLALTLSFPGKLDQALKCAEFPAEDQKLAAGKTLMRFFSQLRRPTKTILRNRNMPDDAPQKWADYLEYNRHDVHAERAFRDRFAELDMPAWEWRLWQLDQKINDRGVPINLDMVDGSIRISDAIVADRIAEMRKITGLDNPNSGTQLLPWLREGGYPFVDLKKGHIARALDMRLYDDDDTRRVLELRRETAKTSVKKYDALAAATDSDGLLRYALQFAGAGKTGRWGGRKFQPHNLPRPHKDLEKRQIEIARDVEVMTWEDFDRKYVDPKTKQALSMEALSAAIRPAVQAPEGYMFVEADLKAIENIGLGWMSGDRKILSVFEQNRDPYINFATYMYGLPYDELWAAYTGGDKHRRQVSKPGVLGCFGPDTPVLTDSGWKRIVDVRPDDRLHDGSGWVAHGGVIARGAKKVLHWFGIYVTPDHKFLVGNRWVQSCQLASRPKELKSALDTASGLLRRSWARPGKRGRFTDAFVRVVSSGTSPDQIYSGDSQQNALDAHRRLGEVGSGSASALDCSMFAQIVSMLRVADARTRPIRDTSITEGEESKCDSAIVMIGLLTWLTTLVGTDRSNVIDETMTDTMSGAIYDLSHVLNRIETRETWDILNAGPNSRFVVLTDVGPLVAHNCGYMLSAGEEYEDQQTGEIEATGLLGYAWNMGIREFTADDSIRSVDVWRSTFKGAVRFWYEIEGAMFDCIAKGRPQYCGAFEFRMKGDFLLMVLPSGRSLKYHRPLIKSMRMPWGKMKESITYMSLDDRHQWVRISTHPGKITQNADEGICRDILATGIRRAEQEGLSIRLHVHDQIIGVVPEREADDSLKLLMDCMTAPISWAPKFPIKAEGHTAKLFVKD